MRTIKKKHNFRVASAQINTTLGDFKSNAEKILEKINHAKERNCDLIVFPESTLFGYHPFDLLEREALVEQQLKQLDKLVKKIPEGIFAIVGVISKTNLKRGRAYYNSAALVKRGKVIRYFHKQLLPTGDVFDEARFIEPGDLSKNIFKLGRQTILVTICEDMWAWPDEKGRSVYKANPLSSLKNKKLDLVVNLSASPFYYGKLEVRKELARKTAKNLRSAFIYTNLVGAQDEIVFDGASFALDSKGKEIMQSLMFEEDLNIIDFPKGDSGRRPLAKEKEEILRSALVLGVRDFCKKVGIEKLHLGLSGGIDSALVACLAVDAMGPQNVVGVAMPSQFNAEESLSLATRLSYNLGIQLIEVSIHKSYEVLKSEIDRAFNISKFGIMHENLQARIRGLILMAYANSKASLLLNTSNKSELAAGYSTLYGDLCGGLSPIGDLTKSEVYELAKLYNSQQEIIPERILARAPSAELRPNQKDEDSLPPYPDLDSCVVKIVEHCKPAKTKTEKWLTQTLFKSEFKRWQAPPILKISTHSFGRGRRFPIAHKSSEL